MATGTAGQNAADLQALGTAKRATAPALALVPKDTPEGKWGTMTASGNAALTAFTQAHGLAAAPSNVQLTPASSAASAAHWVSAKGATTFTVTFAAAPASAANNLVFDYVAYV